VTSAGVRIGVGTRLVHDGELVEIVEIHAGQTGMDVVLKGTSKQALIRARLNELLMSNGTRVIPEREGPSGDDDFEPAGVVLGQLSDTERNEVIDRAAHIREVLTGFRSGSEELALPGEPRREYQADVPLSRRYASKARELGAGVRSVERWVQQFQQNGEAGLASTRDRRTAGLGAKVNMRQASTAPTANSSQSSPYSGPRPTDPKPHSDWTTKTAYPAHHAGGVQGKATRTWLRS
jgi:transposase